jgi:hypothetical protein
MLSAPDALRDCRKMHWCSHGSAPQLKTCSAHTRRNQRAREWRKTTLSIPKFTSIWRSHIAGTSTQPIARCVLRRPLATMLVLFQASSLQILSTCAHRHWRPHACIAKVLERLPGWEPNCVRVYAGGQEGLLQQRDHYLLTYFSLFRKPNTYYSSCYRYKKEYIAKIAVRIVTRCELSFALWIDAYVEGTMASSPGSSFSVRGRTDAYSDSDRNTQPDEEEVVVKMHSI